MFLRSEWCPKIIDIHFLSSGVVPLSCCLAWAQERLFSENAARSRRLHKNGKCSWRWQRIKVFILMWSLCGLRVVPCVLACVSQTTFEFGFFFLSYFSDLVYFGGVQVERLLFLVSFFWDSFLFLSCVLTVFFLTCRPRSLSLVCH